MGVAKQIVDASKATYASLEKRLSGVLKPVLPRREFVHGLGQQFQNVNRPTIVSRLTNIHFILIILVFALSVVAILAVGVRAIISLLGGRRPPLRQA